MIELVSPSPDVIARVFADAVKSYYKSIRIVPNFDVSKKEFGVGTLGRKIAKRYITFSDERELNKYLRNEAPLYISYSVADWRYPKESDLDMKFFEGAELVFEFDDDEFIKYAPNDIVVCGDRYTTVGELLKKRLDPLFCKHGNPTIIPLPSEERWRAIVEKTKELVEILTSDLGFDTDSITINYSGNRGIHVHVHTDLFDGLDHEKAKKIRQEITEYITLHTFNADHVIFTQRDGEVHGPSPMLGGQLGRIVAELVEKLDTTRDPSSITRYISNQKYKARLIRYIHEVGVEHVVSNLLKGIYGPPELLPAWRDLLNGVSELVGIPIDVYTSIDVNRLIRLPNSVHGTTGLSAKIIPLDELDSFSPYKDAVVLPSRPNVTLRIEYLPEIQLNGRTYGPYNNEEVKLPFNVAAYLLGVFGYWDRIAERGVSDDDADR